jgi:hypothetical protein
MPRALSRAGLGDPAVAGRLAAGLAHPRVEPDVADEPVRCPEAGEVTDCRHDGQRDTGVDTGNGHQPQYFGPAERGLAQVTVDQGRLLGMEVELPQQRAGGVLLVPAAGPAARASDGP